MEIKDIQDLLKLINRSNLTDVEIEQKDFRLKVRRRLPENVILNQPAPVAQAPLQMAAPMVPSVQAAPVPAQHAQEVATTPETAGAPADGSKKEEAQETNSNLYEFKSPMIGTFYRAPSPDKPPYSSVGDMVSKGQILCIIEAMKLFNEIESDIEGKIVKILVEDSQPVEYDQPLFLIELS